MGLENKYIDEYIEAEVEVKTNPKPILQIMPLFRNLLDGHSQKKTKEQVAKDLEEEALSLYLEIQEEIDFQNRLEKEKVAIEKVKNILKGKIDFLKDLKDTVNNALPDKKVDVFVENCPFSDCYTGKSYKERQGMRQELVVLNLPERIQGSIDRLQVLLHKINRDIPYALEMVYMNIVHACLLEEERKNCSAYKKLNHLLKDFSFMEKTLSPLLTDEFNSFFTFYKKLASFQKGNDKITKSQLQDCNNQIVYFIPSKIEMLSKFADSLKKDMLYIEGNNVEFNELWQSLNKIITQIKDLDKESHVSFDKLKEYLESYDKKDHLDLTNSFYWEETLDQFSGIYRSYRQLEEIRDFLEDFKESKKLTPKGKLSNKKNKETLNKEFIEVVPPLSDFLNLEPAKNIKEVDRFIEQKKKQLRLWQECIAQRREQARSKKIIQKESSEDKPIDMDKDQADQLLEIYSKISDKSLFDSLFKSESDYKPHNISFRNIELLIKQVGGALTQKGGSHFEIELPNTFITVKKTIKGGSFRPHGSDEWTLRAHQLCRDAFIEAGITPERIKVAQEIKSKSRNEMKNA